MTGYGELRSIGVQFGPFDTEPARGRAVRSRFEASWSDTCSLLARELRHLSARSIVCELDLDASDFRNDGLPRSTARAASPAVRLSFSSKWGPLRYETAEFDSWQSNLRAIALSMESLRRVDRYGVSRRGEQYRGWRQITTGSTPEDQIQTLEQARAVIQAYNLDGDGTTSLAEDIRTALRRSHPDVGGSDVEFRKVTRARALLEGRPS